VETVEIDEVRSDEDIIVLHWNSKGTSNMETHNRVSELVRVALVKSAKGEKQNCSWKLLCASRFGLWRADYNRKKLIIATANNVSQTLR
jgi:hypothetical protein